jgi:hypothetical protein
MRAMVRVVLPVNLPVCAKNAARWGLPPKA